MRYLILSLSFISIISFADDHSKETNFPGLVSTESFNLGNGMEMHVERRNSCNQDGTPKHFHPAAGTLVYVLDGKSQSNHLVNGKNIIKMNIGLKDQIGFMVERLIHLPYLKVPVNNF